MDNMVSQPIIILGMHRSGTELVTRLLDQLNVFVGVDLDSHSESNCFKQINRKLLALEGAHWANPDPFLKCLSNPDFIKKNGKLAQKLLSENWHSYGLTEQVQIWGWKDPRNTLTLPIWLEIFPNASVIHVIRNGIDVGLSLYRRELRRTWRVFARRSYEAWMFPPTVATGYQLWEKYIRVGFSHQNTVKEWLQVRYEDLIDCPMSEIEKIIDFLKMSTSEKTITDLSNKIVRQPTHRSWLDQVQVNISLRVDINTDLLTQLGYPIE